MTETAKNNKSVLEMFPKSMEYLILPIFIIFSLASMILIIYLIINLLLFT